MKDLKSQVSNLKFIMESNALAFLEQLSNSFGPSGFERDAARLVKNYVAGFVDEISQDKLGSLFFKQRGTASEPVILLPGHIDEVGFIVAGINKEGFLTFHPIGGWFDQVLLGQRVKVRTKEGKLLLGIIAAAPPHVLSPEERDKVIKKEKMFIDIGCSNEQEVKKLGVRMGDPIVPDSAFSLLEKPVFEEKVEKGTTTLAVGKGFDDRIGTFIAVEALRRMRQAQLNHPNTVIGAATVQEEVGARGARTAAYMLKPDVCLTLDVDIAGDVPGIDPTKAPCKMGKGPSITTYDSSMIPNQALKDFVIDTAEQAKIPYQLSQIARGGTDAGIIHVSNAGCPSLVLGVATRHIHSHVGILSLEDVEQCINLVIEVLKRLDRDVVQGLTEI
jgi:putative aminopeptidase FrvX